jgi:glycosyltransferase involved in cell wall biosynthesis
MLLDSEVDYSIIICTYNPDKLVFERCLNAVQKLKLDDLQVEVILVDNNSNIALSEQDYIKAFLKNANSNLIAVKEQGLSFARRGGIIASKGKQLIFFDDDNEPNEDYLRALRDLNIKYPHVGAWGPGTVNVDFISGIDPKLLNEAKQAFQDRHEKQVVYSNQPSWQVCYPFGTGLSLRRDYCLGYLNEVDAGRFTLSGRKENELTSGEDTQMIFFAISKGAAAGVAPSLSVKHIVPQKRTTAEYLKRLTYGTSVCYSTCILEVFPDELNRINTHLVSPKKFRIKVLKKMFSLLFTRNIRKSLALINYIGAVSGDYIALKRPVPAVSNWALKILNAI